MARVATANLGAGLWLDGENPGAGSQVADSTGLNGNAWKFDVAIGTEHTTAGAHKTNVIDGPNLKTTVADASTIELAGAPLKLGLKALGITVAHIAAATITAAKLANACIDAAAKISDGIITGAKMVAGTITSTQMAANSIVTAAITDANVTTAKLEYKEYIAIVSQASTSNPSVTVIKNTIGTITPTRSSAGIYLFTSSGLFTVNKTAAWIAPGTVVAFVHAYPVDANNVQVNTENSGGSASDNCLGTCSLMIRVYP